MAKRRGNNEGNIRQRTDHSWEASLQFEDKRHYVYGQTKKEVKSKLADIQNDIYNGTLVEQNDITVAEWMRTWIDCYTAKTKQSTKARYDQDIRNHIIPKIGTIPIQALSDLTVQRFLNHCQKNKGLSEKSLKNIYLVLNKALAKAQSKGLIKVNPCSEAEIPSYEEPRKEMRPLKDTEVPLFLKVIEEDEFEWLFFVAMFTGMRESEIIGLTWDSIDWDKEKIHLKKQLIRTKERGSRYVFTTLKNKQSRDFNVPPSVIKALKKVKAAQAEWKLQSGALYNNTDGLVFTNKLGEHLCTHTVYMHFKKIVEKVGLPEVRFHDLRHTYATLALQNGVDIKTVSSNLGHATVAFTMDKYAHVSETMQKDSVTKMEAFIASL